MADIEELSFDGIVKQSTPASRRRKLLVRLFVGLLLAAMIIGGGWTYWMWQHRWRSITVTVDGTPISIRADTTADTLLRQHHNFGRRHGRLVAVTGDVLNPTGGEAVRVLVNGGNAPLSPSDATVFSDGESVTVDSGADTVEAHTVTREPVPHQASITIKGASIQVLKQAGHDGEREVWVGKTSGRKADKGVIVEPQDTVVEPLTPRPAGRKVIALTFDDGPGPFSAPILDILQSKGVKATFFDIGQSSLAFPDAERRMVADGHQVASHSNTHPDMPELSRDQMRADISAGLGNLTKASGVKTKTFRAPYGAFGDQQWKDASDLIDYNVLWDIDTLDWKRPGPSAIHDNVIRNAHNGAIVLMHDGGGDRSQDVAALPSIIDDLRGQGYEFVTIEQLIALSQQ